MQMRPIVDGLQEEFGDAIAFVYLNAADSGEGQRAFQTLRLPGHPSFVVFSADGLEMDRAFGIVSADRLRTALARVQQAP